MRIAVTGGTGLLGRYITHLIQNHGIRTPIIISRKDHDMYMNLEMRKTDYSIDNLTKTLKGIDAVIHLAAQRGNSNYFTDYQTNITITQNIYEACLNNGIANIVYASTISTYSEQNNLPWDENEIPCPLSMYGISKLNGEHIGNYYNVIHKMNVKNLRFAHIYGSNENNNYMINKFMRQALNKEKLILYSDQPAKREFLYAKDAAQALLCAVEARNLFGTFNIGSGEALKNREVAELINDAFENDGNLYLENRSEILLESSYMNNSKAASILGFKANYSFYEAMREIYGEMSNV